jgi:hypothetical protein
VNRYSGGQIFLLAKLCSEDVLSSHKGRKVSLLVILCARKSLLITSELRARQILQRIRFGKRACEQRDVTFEVTDASLRVAPCRAYERVQ